jgi:signal transduction histidine kinase
VSDQGASSLAGLQAEVGRLVQGVSDEVEEMQSQLRGLERARSFAAAATAQWSLSAVLQAIVDSARDALGARSAALVVIEGHDGRVVNLVHSGMDEEMVGRIAALPRGEGILGVLISDPVSVRLGDLGAGTASVNYSAGDPLMRAFLGVPIHVGGDVFGNLYVTEPVGGGEFSSEDEVLAAVMAVTASGAIANAQRLAESEQRRRWLAAAAELTHRLLFGQTDAPLEVITNAAAAAADADVVTLTVPDGAGMISSRAASGPLAAALKGTSWPAAGTLDDQVMRGGKPVLVDEYPTATALGLDIGPTMVLPLVAGDQVRGAMSLSRAGNRPAFTPAELDMAATFANQATLAMELIDARADQVRLAVLENKERIAEDLHDHVIQELFATGMSLQALFGRLERPEHQQRVSVAIVSLDNVISRIRTAIFELLPQAQGSDEPSLEAAMLAVVTEHTSQLGYSPRLHFNGPVDQGAVAYLIDDITAVTREALSNCARHARATAVTISLDSTPDLITLTITDNGRGIGHPARNSGLSNMRQRAARHGGILQFTSPPTGGTCLTWTAPLLL